MKAFLTLVLLAATPLAVAAQSSGGAPPQAPPGLTLEKPNWELVHVYFFGNGSGGDSGPIHPTPTSRGPSIYPQPGNFLRYSSGRRGGGRDNPSQGDALWRRATVRMTNNGARSVKRVEMEFVFNDTSTGEELLRIRHASIKRLRPGKSFLHQKTVKASQSTRRGDGATLRVELTEVRYADGTVWRP